MKLGTCLRCLLCCTRQAESIAILLVKIGSTDSVTECNILAQLVRGSVTGTTIYKRLWYMTSRCRHSTRHSTIAYMIRD
jgi:hypothetical protein